MNIYLIGYMYSGKTTVGWQLAHRLGFSFVDLDQALESRYHTTVPLLFQRYGEVAFRQLERQELHRTADLDHTVISTGGGCPCHADNMQWINAHGMSVYLDVSLEKLLARAEKSKKQRPSLSGKSPEELRAAVAAQLDQRLPTYRQAQLHVPADDPDIEHLAEALARFVQTTNE